MDVLQLIEYACRKLDEEKYDEALDAFVLAYSKGENKQWLLDNIYDCYVSCNEQIFRSAYTKAKFDSGVSYEDCTLDFIPYRDGEYYIYDKESCDFCGKFSVSELEMMQPSELLEQVEFSAAALEFNGDWKLEKEILADAKNRTIYAVCSNMKKGMSFWKIPELEPYLKNVQMFPDTLSMRHYFHQNTSVYLPKILYGNVPELSKIFAQEHQYRLTPEGRNTDHVLLTIAIPTANRGNLVRKRLENLLQMSYDAEIEIVVSKNCMELYQEEYDKVSQIQDARLLYHDHGKRLTPHLNWHYAVEMAHGKYVLFVSDEDDVQLSALEHYLRLLEQYPEISVARAKSRLQGSMIKERRYGKQGLEAFQMSFLHQNYLSGLIVRRADFLDEHLLDLEVYNKNSFYMSYPHGWWCALLCRRGAFLEDPVILVVETDDVLKEESKKLVESGARQEGFGFAQGTVPGYAAYAPRIEQFRGMVEFIHFYMNDNVNDIDFGLKKAICKTCYLMEMARERHHDAEHFMDFVNQWVAESISAIDTFDFSEEQKLELLQLIQNCAVSMIKTHNTVSAEEKNLRNVIEEDD